MQNSTNWNLELEDLYHDLQLAYTYTEGKIKLVNDSDSETVLNHLYKDLKRCTCNEDFEYIEGIIKYFKSL